MPLATEPTLDAREREFDKLKVRLEELRHTLRGRLGRINTHLRRSEPDEAIEYEEQAQQAENDEVLEHLDRLGIDVVQRLEFAQRNHRVQHRVRVDVHEVERPRAVTAPGAAHRHDRARGQFVAGFRYVASRPDLVIVFVMVFLIGAFGMASFMAFLGNIKLYLAVICGAVTFTILLVSANTVAMTT